MVFLSTVREAREFESVQLYLNRVLQVAIVGTLLEGVRRRNPGVTTNGLAALCFAVTPRFLETRYDVRLRPWQRLWISASSLVHSLGMLGPYDRVWWWDHVTHTLTSVVVAGATDVVYRAESRQSIRSGATRVPFRSRASAIVGVTLGFGLLWELLEFAVHAAADRMDFQPPLVHYGRRDTVVDVVFDLIGAGLIVLLGDSALSNVLRQLDDADGLPAVD